MTTIEWKRDNSNKREEGSIIPIVSEKSGQKVEGEITVEVTFHRPKPNVKSLFKFSLKHNQNHEGKV